MPDTAISRFALYEEPGAEVELDFLHVEGIPHRSGRHDWTIHPHSHPAHAQILLVTRNGGGSLRVEDRTWPLAAPCLMVIPAGMVHAIAFDPETDGYVATVATAFLTAATGNDRRLREAAAHPDVHPLGLRAGVTPRLEDIFRDLLREFLWPAPGRRTAILAHLQRLLVELLRLQGEAQRPAAAASGAHDVVLRYRALIEAHFRDRKRLGFYAGRLGLSLSKLNACCRAVAGASASGLLYDRIVVEAKRSLLYTGQGVAEIAHAIGFDDPAYFNRFFTRRVGLPPGQFRAQGGSL